MKVSVQSSALVDLRKGFRFYEGKERGLGAYFLDSLYSDIDSLQLYAGIHPIHFGGFQRLLSGRFPFAIYYKVDNEVARVVAILDLRRDPATNARRLLEEE